MDCTIKTLPSCREMLWASSVSGDSGVRVVSLGAWCGIKTALRNLQLDGPSLPFDWTRSSIDTDTCFGDGLRGVPSMGKSARQPLQRACDSPRENIHYLGPQLLA
eukprot:gnl/TRDRNA2_/TRDRNA2_172652_c2_seq1.p1 gnl/TRDRNA2_/TRDRNA2_172652_c2~~gnl/TRDRNA2_/TRDRNA2_172652_c2_seq1.p1  ORF type:complete len:105 (-),score=6.40 gnl/TRDRNA2_/TRDRNA2_172652_c2_seq1:121-435(-)